MAKKKATDPQKEQAMADLRAQGAPEEALQAAEKHNLDFGTVLELVRKYGPTVFEIITGLFGRGGGSRGLTGGQRK